MVENGTVSVVDTVEYRGLVAGETYTAHGTIMDKKTGLPLEDSDGNPVTSTAEFVAEGSEGTVEVTFEFDASQLEEGAALVAFEEVLDVNGNVIAVHQDIDDEDQTVVVDNPETLEAPGAPYDKPDGNLLPVWAAIGVLVVGDAAAGAYTLRIRIRQGAVDADGASSEEDHGSPKVDWEYWLSVNPDIVVSVSVPGTNVDYPVVQASTDDPTFYLDHDVYRGWNPYGCPYLDAGCAERGIDSPLALMFAHHMDDGSMFSAFAGYSDRGVTETHDEILLQTPEGDIRLNVIAADVVDSNAEYKRLEFADGGELGSWLEGLLAEADVMLEADVETDSVKALCTCSYGRRNGHERTIVYARE